VKTHVKFAKSILAAASCTLIGAVAYAAVTINYQTGEGFVGKGDVQSALGWSNKQLQSNHALVQFRNFSTIESSWDCLNSNNEKVKEWNNKSKTTRAFSYTTRDNKKQITGFTLTGWDGSSTEIIKTIGSDDYFCPPSSTYVADSFSSTDLPGGGLQVSGGNNWVRID
jgi:hypothetical protein